MPRKASQSPRPEAELEVLLSAALAQAFPHIPRTQFHHQTRFTIHLGHEGHEIDGGRRWTAAGRADLVLFHMERALAVVELKREDQALTEADRRQGQSYASQMTPRPPLVILTNGRTTDIYDSSTGEKWLPAGPAGDVVARLFANAATVAAAGLAWAVEVLMGPEAGVWTSAVRTRTTALIEQMSGAPGDHDKPFVRGFYFSRLVTAHVHPAFDQGARVVLISGPPLIGKSHVLREFAERTAEGDTYAVFMIRAGGHGAGLFQRIANLLSAAVEWSVSADDVRQWLRRLSLSGHGPTLVLALDGLTAGSAVANDIEELAEAGFGPRLRILATVDDARALQTGANGRDATALAGLAVEMPMAPLNAAEFARARNLLADHGIGFTAGADFALEYRVPWVLRAVFADAIATPEHQNPKVLVVLPASQGVNLVTSARVRLGRYSNVQRGYRLLARDFIADTEPASAALSLAMTHTFLVRQDALSRASQGVVSGLISQGWLRAYRHAGGDDLIVPCAPEFFLSELAAEVSAQLDRRVTQDSVEAGQWLAIRLEGFFLGDLIGAQAIIDLQRRRGGCPPDLIEGVFARKPRVETFRAGLVAFAGPDGSLQNFLVTEAGKGTLADEFGQPYGEEIDLTDDDDLPQMQSDLAGWMILAQFARVRSVLEADGAQRRADWMLLLEIGMCPIPLIRVAGDPVGHLVHDIEGQGTVLCKDNGVIEAATAAMQQMFSTDWASLNAWFDEALKRESLPLLNRIAIALNQVGNDADQDKAAWARDLLTARINPAAAEILAKRGPSARIPGSA